MGRNGVVAKEKGSVEDGRGRHDAVIVVMRFESDCGSRAEVVVAGRSWDVKVSGVRVGYTAECEAAGAAIAFEGAEMDPLMIAELNERIEA